MAGMHLACPSCAASYQVPDALIGAGRQMRCVRCGEDWFAVPPGMAREAMEAVAPPIIAAPPPPAPAASAEPARPPIAARPRPSLTLPLAWLASAAVWAGAGYALWAMRERLTALWPPIARLYALLD